MNAPAPVFADPDKQIEWSVVEGIAEALRHKGHDLRFHDAPDIKGRRQAGPGGLVDFLLIDIAARGVLWNVELKRLVPAHVREQYEFARRKLARLAGRITGTYTAAFRIDAGDASSRVNESALETLIARVLGAAVAGRVDTQYDVVPDCVLRQVAPEGSRAVPWIWDYELDLEGPRTDAVLELLRYEFLRHLANARLKFDSRDLGSRGLLILETRGSLLDREIHIWPSAKEPGLMSTWMAASSGWQDNDMVIVDPHVSVYQADDAETGRWRSVLMGTRYSEDSPFTPLGTPWRLWPKPAGPI